MVPESGGNQSRGFLNHHQTTTAYFEPSIGNYGWWVQHTKPLSTHHPKQNNWKMCQNLRTTKNH